MKKNMIKECKKQIDEKEIEERRSEVQLVFNIVGSGFGEEIDESIKNMKCVSDYINGDITRDELAEQLLASAKNGD